MNYFCAIIAIGLLMTSCSHQPEKLNCKDWQIYKQNFVSSDGRIIDVEQQGISHSEGQGYGLILACAYQDRESFDHIWAWSKKNLQVRKDSLFAWRWRDSKTGGAVDDFNNASDGELLIAWALCRAHRQWKEPKYLVAALQICQQIRKDLLCESSFGLVVLPGAVGFEQPNGLVLNLSYWVFPAFKDLAAYDPAPEWEKLRQSGLRLLQQARFGVFGLPPDWLVVGKTVELATSYPPIYGYNAVRVPLHLVWAGDDQIELIKPFLDYWASFHTLSSIAATLNLVNNQQSVERAFLGMQAIAQLTQGLANRAVLSQNDLPFLSAKESYFSASLLLLTKIALQERTRL